MSWGRDGHAALTLEIKALKKELLAIRKDMKAQDRERASLAKTVEKLTAKLVASKATPAKKIAVKKAKDPT